MASFDNAGSDVFKEDWIKYGVKNLSMVAYFIAMRLGWI
jgi:hypothetical protein